VTVLDTRTIVPGLTTLECVALIPRVSSTNLVARRIVRECVENEVALPQAIIVAGEQFAGKGRNQRSWSSPAGKGIYATTLISRPVTDLPAVPFAVANIVAAFFRETFKIDARIKWPNDILVGGRKIAGILIEARVQDDRTFLIIGTGLNIEPVEGDDRPNATTLSQSGPEGFNGIDDATRSFIHFIDRRLGSPFDRAAVLDEWRNLAIHKQGDRVTCVIGERTVEGTWQGVDEHGRALLRSGDETIEVSAGDLILAPS
jgi:BirA family biotin operon repressor/biotin-[acetyl-CoA-carboxylase] ligase